MKISLNNFKRVTLGLFLAVVLSVGFAPVAQAQSYYYVPAYQSQVQNQAQIQALLNQVAVLMAELQALQHAATYVYPTSRPVVSYPQYRYYGGYDVSITNEDYDVVNDNEVTLSADIRLNRALFANVWFEYGQNGDLDEDTSKVRITSSKNVEVTIRNVDEDERYYFRTIAENPSGELTYGAIKSFETDGNSNNNQNNDDEPEVVTKSARNISDDFAQLEGFVDMNDFSDGTVFFVYGEDESMIDDVVDENSYTDINEDGYDLQKVLAGSNISGSRTYWASVYGLDSDTDFFFRICAQYDDEDDDRTLVCGDVEDFATRY